MVYSTLMHIYVVRTHNRQNGDLFAHYSEVRGEVALKASELNFISAAGSNQVCGTRDT